MPWSGSVYTLPPGTTATTLTAISSTDYNAFVNDVEASFNDIVDGTVSWVAAVKASDGTVSAPGISFGSDTDTGLYRIGANNMAVAVGGVKLLDFASAAVSITGTLGVSSTVTLATGTTSIAPLNLPAGTVKTTVAAGDMEHDGKVFYLSSAASSRQAVSAVQFVTNVSAVALSNSSTSAQNVFPSANDTLTLQGSTTYRFNALIWVSKGTTGSTTNFGFGGTATFTSIMIHYQGFEGNTVTAFTGQSRGVNITASAAAVSSSTNTFTNNLFRLEGTMRVNSGGTIIPQITFSAGPGGTCQVEPNSFFEIRPLGSDTVAAVGNWA